MKYCLTLALITAWTISSGGCGKETTEQDAPPEQFTAEKRLLADQIISCFENSNPIIQYDYVENLNDGRGYTAGRAGFTTATCDLLEVVNRYTQQVPSNPLATFIPRLKTVCANADPSVSGLENLPKAWKTAANDAIFKKIQDDVVNEFYFNPALKYFQNAGLKYPLSLLNLYDACIQHGDGTDPDGLAAMIKRTNQAAGGSPTEGVDETKWLDKFMEIRKNTLLNATDPATKEAWRESVDRVDALRRIFDSKNLNLKAPLKLVVWGDTFNLPQ